MSEDKRLDHFCWSLNYSWVLQSYENWFHLKLTKNEALARSCSANCWWCNFCSEFCCCFRNWKFPLSNWSVSHWQCIALEFVQNRNDRSKCYKAERVIEFLSIPFFYLAINNSTWFFMLLCWQRIVAKKPSEHWNLLGPNRPTMKQKHEPNLETRQQWSNDGDDDRIKVDFENLRNQVDFV